LVARKLKSHFRLLRLQPVLLRLPLDSTRPHPLLLTLLLLLLLLPLPLPLLLQACCSPLTFSRVMRSMWITHFLRYT
jgi:hypothetical protein